MLKHKEELILTSRNNASNGLWLTVLLPLVLYCIDYQMKEDISFLTLICFFTMLSGISWFYLTTTVQIQSSYANNLSKEANIFNHSFIILGISMLPYLFIEKDWIYLLLLSAVSHLLFIALCKYILCKASSSFTLGELYIVAQGIVLFLIGSIYELFMYNKNDIHSNTSEIRGILQIFFLMFGVSIFILNILHLNAFLNLLSLFLVGCFSFYIIFRLTSLNLLFWFISFIMKTNFRTLLLVYWAGLMIVALLLVISYQSKSVHLSIRRKYFHLLMVAVYIPGVLYDAELLYLMSGLLLLLFIILEFLRINNTPFISFFINKSVQKYLDAKDQGVLILSHIYLLIGCTIPIWLWPSDVNLSLNTFNRNTFELCGIFSLGIGDAAAAAGGILWGLNKWPGTRKTIEGTLCNILAQLLILFLLINFGFMPLSSNEFNTFILVILVGAICEAFTDQVDNLVLPLATTGTLVFLNLLF